MTNTRVNWLTFEVEIVLGKQNLAFSIIPYCSANPTTCDLKFNSLKQAIKMSIYQSSILDAQFFLLQAQSAMEMPQEVNIAPCGFKLAETSSNTDSKPPKGGLYVNLTPFQQDNGFLGSSEQFQGSNTFDDHVWHLIP